MVANLNGVIFDQVYGDNSGGAEFDTDGDGTTTQEDEFVSLLNTTGATIDLSGWQIWSDMAGSGAPDPPQDGLFHTFPPGTTLAAGKVLYIVNEYTGTAPSNIQESSEGGVESGAGGINTNFLTEGDGNASSGESLALVDPVSGNYIILNMAGSAASSIPTISGFPGTTNVGTTNAATQSGQEDINAGSSYQYNASTNSYDYGTVFVACFESGTDILTPRGQTTIDKIKVGDLIETRDNGPQPVRMILRRTLDFTQGDDPRHKPVEFKPNALGTGQPQRRLVVSPQHRMLIHHSDKGEALAPAKGLAGLRGVRVMAGRRMVTYIHLVFARHEIINSNGCWSESFYPGKTARNCAGVKTRAEISAIFPKLDQNEDLPTARPFLRVREARALAS